MNDLPAAIRNLASRSAGPAFLHSGFRTSSTWLWDKLRASPHIIAYYEIFHEQLASLNSRGAAESHSQISSWRSNHPRSAPYFLEFTPLFRPEGGVRGYESSMAMERFVPEGGMDGVLSEAEISYVGGLIEAATAHGKRPLLTCTRTLGRAKALKKAFGGAHVLLVRNLFHQWGSFSSQAHDGNIYFLQQLDLMITHGRGDAFVRAIDDWFSHRQLNAADEALFTAFLVLHLYLYAHAHDAADAVVDVDRLSDDREHRTAVERALTSLAAWPIDLGDVRSHFEHTPLVVQSINQLEAMVDQFMKLVPLEGLSEEATDFAQRRKTEAFEALRQHEFFGAGQRAVQTRLLAQLHTGAAPTSETPEPPEPTSSMKGARADNPRSSLAAVEAERDDLAAQLVQARADYQTLGAALHATTGERDSLSQALNAKQLELETAIARRNAVAGERDGLAARVARSDADRRTLDSVTAERDALAARGNDLAARLEQYALDYDALGAALHAAASERDALAEALSVERTDWTTRFLQMEADYDQLGAALHAAIGERDDFEVRLAKATADNAETVAILKGRYDKASKALAAARLDLDAKTGELVEALATGEALRGEAVALRREIEAMTHRLDGLDRELSGKTAELAAKTSELRTMENKLSWKLASGLGRALHLR